ncbi:hypothetical protein CPB86DRAFT_780530 [Serendipita vermifera]|nr:hypothetical protein CPB86DRAFT_780530 [Serendipita vermifera]
MPSSIPATFWEVVYSGTWQKNYVLYSGIYNYALSNRWRRITQDNAELAPSRIINLIWTDMVANVLIGTDTATRFLSTELKPTLSYDILYGIPFILLLVVWILSFLSMVLVPFKGLKPQHLRSLLNQTSIGIREGGSRGFFVDHRRTSNPGR